MSNQPKEHEDDFDDDFDTDVEENLDLEDFDIEIEDDTPEEDRGRPRRAEGEEPDIPDDEELKQYSKNAGKRISKLKAEYHEERRQKEESTRLREEAIDYARKIKEENDRLRKNLEEGESVLISQSKARISAELGRVKDEYKTAMELGDTDAVITAQEKLFKLQSENSKVEDWTPPKKQEIPEFKPTQEYRAPEPDARAKEWSDKNTWFNSNKSMQRYALLIHEELSEMGIAPNHEKYYSKIDAAMRRRYPDVFDDAPESRPQQRQISSVVAPTSRGKSTSRQVVKLTKTQASLAKRLGLSEKDYAAQVLKDMKNG
jgi:hypothetical protein